MKRKSVFKIKMPRTGKLYCWGEQSVYARGTAKFIKAVRKRYAAA